MALRRTEQIMPSEVERLPRSALAATAILCLLAILYVYVGRLIGPNDLFRKDQAKTMAYTVDVIANGRFSLPRDPIFQPATKPPLYNWIAAAFIGPTGIYDEWAQKLPSLVSALAIALLVFAWCRRNFLDALGRQHALLLAMLASAIWIASKSTILLLYIARPDMVQALCLIGAWLAGHAALKHATKREATKWAAVFWLAVTAAALAKGPAAVYPILYVLLAAPLLFGDWRRLANLRWLVGLPVLLGSVGLWLFFAYRQDPEHVKGVLIGTEVVKRIASSNPEGFVKPWHYSITWFRTQNTVWSYLMIGSMIVSLLGSLRRALGGDDSGRRIFDHLRIRSTEGFFTGAAGAANLWAVVVVGCLSIPKDKRMDFLLPAHPAAAILAAHFIVFLVSRFAWARFALPLGAALFLLDEKRSVGAIAVLAVALVFTVLVVAIALLIRHRPRLLPLAFALAAAGYVIFELLTNTRFGIARFTATSSYIALIAGAAVVAALMIAAFPRRRLELPLVAFGIIFWGYALLQNNYKDTGLPGTEGGSWLRQKIVRLYNQSAKSSGTNPSVYAARFAKQASAVVGDDKVVMIIRSKSPILTLMGRHQGSYLTRRDFEEAKWVIVEQSKFPALKGGQQEAVESGKLDIDFGNISGFTDIYKDRVSLYRIDKERGVPSVDEMISIHRWVTSWTTSDANPYRSANTGWIESPSDPPIWTPPPGDPWEKRAGSTAPAASSAEN